MLSQDQDLPASAAAAAAAAAADDDDAGEDPLALTISFPCQRARPPAPMPAAFALPAAAAAAEEEATAACVFPGAARVRRNPNVGPRAGKPGRIPPPFPWATDERAHVHRLSHILALGVRAVSDRMQCLRCEAAAVVSYDLAASFRDVAGFLAREQLRGAYDRAPPQLLRPAMPGCGACGQAGAMRPVLAAKKRGVNWLFLFLGRALGCCNLRQLKYFCKHNGFHRTGAKDRVVYTAYVLICKQLDPASLPLSF